MASDDFSLFSTFSQDISFAQEERSSVQEENHT
jgi:hypothetical protein